jgi:hypothetical protein
MGNSRGDTSLTDDVLHPPLREESFVPMHPRAGRPAEPSDLVNVARLVTAYYTEHPDPSIPE